tara:strand:+ start:1332 stop:2027 length:696 start_codon:yes stop_codon:yes gene_type:complete
MATSGTYAFDLEIEEVIEEAYEQIGIEYKTSEQLRTARRSLNLMLLEWVNDDVPLWGIDQTTIALTTDSQSYAVDAQWVDFIDVVIRDSNSVDVSATRLSMSEYLSRPTKATQGKPIQYCIERNTSGNTLYVWPVASDNTYTLVAWGLRYLQDVGDYDNTMDVPRRFLPALCAGLAYNLAKKNLAKNPEVIVPLLNPLKADYKEIYEGAKWEDRERANLYLLPTRRAGRTR